MSKNKYCVSLGTPLLCALFIVTSIVISGCSGDSNRAGVTRIQLSGSSTVGPLAEEIGKRYEKLNPDVRIEVQTGGSSRGIAEAKSGLADIGMSSRALKDSETDGRMAWPIAMDGVCFIVHADNPVSSLSRSQLLSIIKGDVDNWKQFGGADESIVFINRAAGRSELELVTKFFDVGAADLNADLVAGENQQGIKMVATNANSICYMSVGASEDAVSNGEAIKTLPLEGVAATISNVESGAFPLSRPLIFVTGDQPSKSLTDFIEFAQSEEVVDLLRELSYVPISK